MYVCTWMRDGGVGDKEYYQLTCYYLEKRSERSQDLRNDGKQELIRR